MTDDAKNAAPSPLWVRVFRTTFCFTVAAGLAWRGYAYEEPTSVSVAPFVMCQMTAIVLALVGLMSLDGSTEPGPT